MILKGGLIAVTAIFYMFSWSASAQATRLGKNCDLAVFGDKNPDAFLTFDRDLRSALQARDIGKIALLVQFPLMVTDQRGKYYIHEAASLQGHFDEIFSQSVEQAILKSTRESIWCNYSGISYGNGDLWIDATDHGYFLVTINQLSKKKDNPRKDWAISLACHTDKHRILIDLSSESVARYRAWNADQPLTNEPDLEIPKGKVEFEGTGPCSYQVWTFQNGRTEYRLESTDRCIEDPNGPPKNAQAELFIKTPEQSEPNHAWCY